MKRDTRMGCVSDTRAAPLAQRHRRQRPPCRARTSAHPATPRTSTAKAAKAATQIKKGAGSKDVAKRSKVHFFRPKTLSLDKTPKYPRKSMPLRVKMDKHQIIKYPLTTEVCCGGTHATPRHAVIWRRGRG